MDHRLQMRVVEFQNIGADLIEECRGKRIGLFTAANHRRMSRTEERRQSPDCQLDRIIAAPAERGADEIYDHALGLAARFGGDVPPMRFDQELGELPGGCWR